MTLDELKKSVRTGDVLLVDGDGFVSNSIEILTGDAFSHVAMLLELDGDIWVAEMIEGVGYQKMHLADWLKKTSGHVYYGMAPVVVRKATTNVFDYLAGFELDKKRQQYGWFTLVRVWVGKWFKRKLPTSQEVCCTFAQEYWEACGYQKFTTTPAPGDFKQHVLFLALLEG